MSKVQLVLLIALSMLASLLMIGGTAFSALADDTYVEQIVQTDDNAPDSGEPNETSPKDGGIDGNPEDNAPLDDPSYNLSVAVDKFVEFLKAKYGEDYEFYYNQIIEHWGSIEAYLFEFGSTLPIEYQNGWEAAIGWLGTYSVIWAPVLAIIIVIAVAVIARKQFDKIIEKVVISKLSPIVQEINSQSKKQDLYTRQQYCQLSATLSTTRSLKALMANNAKFAENVKELEASEKELSSEKVQNV